MDICQWCWKPIEKTDVPNYHEYCIVSMADFFDYMDTEAHKWENADD